jgi:hypothetical protein
MSALDRALAWTGANLVPLVLLPLAVLLLWVGIWRVWLPPARSGGVAARTVTTVDASTDPTHRVTSVVRSSRSAAPSRRSETLALVLVLLGAGAAVVGVFNRRIASLELGKDGVKIDLTVAERSGAAALVGRLAESGAPARSYGRGVERYLRAVSARRTPSAVKGLVAPGLGEAEAAALAGRIADDLVS